MKKDLDNLDITIIGLGYEHQIVKENFGESHDLKYHKVFTETNIHNFS